MRKLIYLLIILALAGFIGWRVYVALVKEKSPAGGGGAGRRPAGAVAVVVEPVRRERVADIAEFTGSLISRSQFLVAPKVSGRLLKLLVNIGDTVKSGDLIAEIDSDEYEQQVAQASAELEVTRANLAEARSAMEVARREFERAKELREQKVASEAELDTAEAHHQAAQARYHVAEAQIRQREAALKTAEVRLSYTRISTGWGNGDVRRVAEKFVDEGTMLRANDPIVSIVDLQTVLAVIYVIEKDFPAVRAGQDAMITTDAYPQSVFNGSVVRRAPVLREDSRQARVEIEIPNTDGRLAPGMFVRVRIQFEEHEDVAVVPTSALVTRNGRRGVFLVDSEAMKANFVPVQTGIVQGEITEIVAPELSGNVVTLGHHLLEDQAAVVLPGRPAAGRRPPEEAP